MKKILVTGVTGMLGSMVFDYLSRQSGFDVRGTNRGKNKEPGRSKGKIIAFDADTQGPEDLFTEWTPDLIINCIGLIKPYCKDTDPEGVMRAIRLNTKFPHDLAVAARKRNVRVIQIATDCVWSGLYGRYLESSPHDAHDVYGKSKSLGEVHMPNFLNIRTSVIGPEMYNKLSLLEWFLSRKSDEKLKGFLHHHWNGVTTLQFAQVCEVICNKGAAYFDELTKVSNVHHLILNETVNKNELVNIFNKVWNKGFLIEPVDNIGAPVDRTLATKYSKLSTERKIPMEQAVTDLKKYIDKHYSPMPFGSTIPVIARV